MNKYLNLMLSAGAAAALAGATVVAAGNHDWWVILSAATVNGATAVVQHMRHWPQEKWTDAKREAEKEKA